MSITSVAIDRLLNRNRYCKTFIISAGIDLLLILLSIASTHPQGLRMSIRDKPKIFLTRDALFL